MGEEGYRWSKWPKGKEGIKGVGAEEIDGRSGRREWMGGEEQKGQKEGQRVEVGEGLL